MMSNSQHIIPMILAAGLGTRLGTLTADKPKALVGIEGQTLLEITLNRFKKFGFEEVIINIHHFSQQIINYLKLNDNFGMKVIISDETSLLMDTGGALLKALPLVPEGKSLLVHNVDIITSLNLNDLIAKHLRDQNDATLVVRKRDSSRYLLFDTHMQLVGWQNKVTAELKQVNHEMPASVSAWAFSGIHLINPVILGSFPVVPCSVIDLFLALAQTKKIRAFQDNSDVWIDVGKAEQLEQLSKESLNI